MALLSKLKHFLKFGKALRFQEHFHAQIILSFSFFEEFYRRNGPLTINDELFKKAITSEMLLLSELRYPNFIEFLVSKKDT